MQSALDRRQAMLELLSDRRQETIPHLMAIFGVSRITVMRNIKILCCSAPIYTVPGRGGGVRIADGYLMHRWPKAENYDWLHENHIVVKGKDICNWLIHSYVFFLVHDEEGRVCSFCVSSDYDRNKALCAIGINEWLDYIDSLYPFIFDFGTNKEDYAARMKSIKIIVGLIGSVLIRYGGQYAI